MTDFDSHRLCHCDADYLIKEALRGQPHKCPYDPANAEPKPGQADNAAKQTDADSTPGN